MKQYLDLLKEIKTKGTYKAAAREGMPGTISRFGYQFRHDLSEGFPLLTTKKLSWKNIVVELLWFLRGDTNVKYLIDNGCNIWNEDAYNYFCKKCKQYNLAPFDYEMFIEKIQKGDLESHIIIPNYKLGDCGKQYGWLWRNWKHISIEKGHESNVEFVDQLKELIEGLKKNPMGRRHIITAWNPATLDDMALNACHAMTQFNCRPKIYKNTSKELIEYDLRPSEVESKVGELNLPKYYLDCQMYQRSADVFLGVPYNLASYSLLTHLIVEMLNMVPGEFIHSFGDVHIYDNHIEQVDLQLTREPKALPELVMKLGIRSLYESAGLDRMLEHLDLTDFEIRNYNADPTIKAKLSTGLK